MHTLILNGSPRPSGDTAALIAALRPLLSGDVTQVDCYRAKISPCTDCRQCAKKPGCAIRDDMQALYPLIERCDRIVVASPVYFTLPTPPLVAFMSRLQTYFSASALRGQPVPIAPKRGGILLAGGGGGSAEPAKAVLRILLHTMGARPIGPVVASLNTDKLPAAQDERAFEQLRALAAFLETGAPADRPRAEQ